MAKAATKAKKTTKGGKGGGGRGSSGTRGQSGRNAATGHQGNGAGSAVRPQADIPCEFGNVSIGQATASIGVSIDPAAISVDRVHALFNGKRATVRLVQVPAGEQPGQRRMDGMEAPELTAVTDIRGYRMSPKVISARLAFTIEGLDLSMLASHFSKRSGRLLVISLQEIPQGEASGGDDGGDEGDEDDIDGEMDPDEGDGDSDADDLKGI